MFELFADDTPNARKVSIMLEEIQAEYKVTLIDIGKGDQFKDDFKKISPFNNKPEFKISQTAELDPPITVSFNVFQPSNSFFWNKNFFLLIK